MLRLMTTVLVNEWLKKYPPESIIGRAHQLAKEVHQHEKRLDGHPYLSHVTMVAKMVADLNLDENSIAAALLHDAIENTPLTIEDIRKQFGEKRSTLVSSWPCRVIGRKLNRGLLL